MKTVLCYIFFIFSSWQGAKNIANFDKNGCHPQGQHRAQAFLSSLAMISSW
jgi:hypothetical protein